MSVVVDVREMERTEVESALLLHAGLARRLLEAVRSNSRPEWKVARECELIAAEYQPLLNRAFRRGVDSGEARIVTERRAARHDRMWAGLEEPRS